MRKFLAITSAAVLAVSTATPVLAGGYEGVLETYKLQKADGSSIVMYERPDISSPVLTDIPSGTVVRILKGNPEGWMLIEYNGVQGCVTDGGVVILCSGAIAE